MKKISIIMIVLGICFVGMALFVGFTNNFSEGQGGLLLIVGGSLLGVGIVFTPKIWQTICNLIDIVTMFFQGLK